MATKTQRASAGNITNKHTGSAYRRYFFTVQDLSGASGLSEETIRRHIRDGKLDPYSLIFLYEWMINHVPLTKMAWKL